MPEVSDELLTTSERVAPFQTRAVTTIINATLSYDHRLVDGALRARVLDALREEIAAL